MLENEIHVITVRTRKQSFEVPNLSLGAWELSQESTSIQLGAELPGELSPTVEVLCSATVGVDAAEGEENLGYSFTSEILVGIHIVGTIANAEDAALKKAVAQKALSAAHSVYKSQLHQMLSSALMDVSSFIPFELPSNFGDGSLQD